MTGSKLTISTTATNKDRFSTVIVARCLSSDPPRNVARDNVLKIDAVTAVLATSVLRVTSITDDSQCVG